MSKPPKLQELKHLVDVISRGKYQWETTFDAITAPVMIVGKDYHIERANLTTASVGNKDIRKIIGERCYEMFAGREKPCDGCPLAKTVSKNIQSSNIIQDKISSREFEAHAYPYIIKGKKPDAAVMYYRDVTEEKRLWQEAVQREKMAAIGLLAGGVAHEINNPLGGILAMTQLLIRDAQDNAELLDDLKEVESAAIRCKKIVSDLLDFSRDSKGQEKCPTDINLLVTKTIPFVRTELERQGVKVAMELSPNLPNIMGSPDRIQQIFLNLISNACHAMPGGGVLTIGSRVRGKEFVEVCVHDTGIGISKEDINKVFEPFFTTKCPTKGTGLGLSIVYRIVKDHNGLINVESEKNKGTTFSICFPIAK